MITTIITDCHDANATGRSVARATALLKYPTQLVGVGSDLEAAGNLIDLIDATDGEGGVVLANVAPRDHYAKKWPNGTPFGYFYYQNILVVSTIDGLTLSLAKKYGLIDQIQVVDIPAATKEMAATNFIADHLPEYIANSQFRSFDFMPRLAAYLLKYKKIISQPLPIEQIPDAPAAIWWVDNFGNCKTTLWASEFAAELNKLGKTDLIASYKGLKDVPDDQVGLITGSSGLDSRRFAELVLQGGSVAKKYNLVSGDDLKSIINKISQ
ncbi:MAG: hypothetical protein COX77_04940 [Candidatus Komeilibacteria bacterium CG_4_10_14_0_2_um_filter_37_10]|uniref:Uncharacterized protein n=1 Tax=Candidatus Komeilibacteria bacterium CG_4_10_14_0_2_um_filter_37_10 TaxID=1974470 RepID=A0A2M7VD51_9BACT|nr:MAG: hypothetical protein COX77_04940 [Candidatus Komeilibacteria bacterium CG_4_10_14_0_2_um_filter_37_10]